MVNRKTSLILLVGCLLALGLAVAPVAVAEDEEGGPLDDVPLTEPSDPWDLLPNCHVWGDPEWGYVMIVCD